MKAHYTSGGLLSGWGDGIEFSRPWRLRVLIVDESRLASEAMMFALGSDPRLDAVGYCADGPEAFELVSAYRADVVVIGAGFTGLEQLELCELIHNSFPRVRLISLRSRLVPEEVEALYAAGVADCLATSCSADELLRAIADAETRQIVFERARRDDERRARQWFVSMLEHDA
jgi:DNA-binding NarL/FixJ family response regulator